MPRTRILHLSDLHVGKREDAGIEEALAAFVAEAAPELVVVSGDLTHRGRREQHERARRFLASLGPPVLAVPGNHDIPLWPPARLARPWTEFERLWQTTEPTVATAGAHVVGLNSVRPFRHQSGALGEAQLERAASRLAEAAPGALRVVVLHHQLVGSPWRAARKRPLSHRDRVLHRLAQGGAELILSGHIHQSAVSERREFEVVGGGDGRRTVVATAPGLGRPRPYRLGEARGLHLHEADGDALAVRTHVWDGHGWALVAERRFPRR